MNTCDLDDIAKALVAPGKGILAADESFSTIEKRFKEIGLPSTEENRRAYREVLFTTPGVAEFISGIILFDETLHQQGSDGTPIIDCFRHQGILPGIKVDLGAKPLPGFSGEKITEGLDGLGGRLENYAKRGAVFTKWRAVVTIGPGLPSRTCLTSNAEALARFAALSQAAGLVPIIEPEVLMDGDHTIERHGEVTEEILRLLFPALAAHRVRFESLLLKTNMVLPGTDNPTPAPPNKVAEMTLRVLLHTVPPAVPGIVFLSGGQKEIAATECLNAISRAGGAPWAQSFSFGRALQDSAMKIWAGKDENVPEAQSALLRRARANSAARLGMYSSAMETECVEEVIGMKK